MVRQKKGYQNSAEQFFLRSVIVLEIVQFFWHPSKDMLFGVDK